MKRLKWILYAVVLLGVGAFLHAHLPQHDIVRILGTEIKRESVEIENEQGETITRNADVRYISAAFPDGSVYVYRNEDTGWGFPPYFKFDSANLAAQADNATSTEKDPEWYVVTHYGWRITYFSWFPNAIAIERATGPNQSVFPWFSVVFLGVLALVVLIVRARIKAWLSEAAERRVAEAD